VIDATEVASMGDPEELADSLCASAASFSESNSLPDFGEAFLQAFELTGITFNGTALSYIEEPATFISQRPLRLIRFVQPRRGVDMCTYCLP
jgi:hypothetical protein